MLRSVEIVINHLAPANRFDAIRRLGPATSRGRFITYQILYYVFKYMYLNN